MGEGNTGSFLFRNSGTAFIMHHLHVGDFLQCKTSKSFMNFYVAAPGLVSSPRICPASMTYGTKQTTACSEKYYM